MLLLLVGLKMLHVGGLHPILPFGFIATAIYLYVVLVVAGSATCSFWKMSYEFIVRLRSHLARISPIEETRDVNLNFANSKSFSTKFG